MRYVWNAYPSPEVTCLVFIPPAAITILKGHGFKVQKLDIPVT